MISFGLFGTLVTVEGRSRSRSRSRSRPSAPAAAVARELSARGIDPPADWATAYAERHVDAPPGASVPLPAHVAAALRSRGVAPRSRSGDGNAVRRAVVAAFDPSIDARPGVREAVAAAAERGPVGLVSNCVVPELVGRTLVRAGLREAIDVVVTSAGCGWRKPDPRPFEALARRADRTPADLVHVGGDPRTDAGVVAAGGRYVHVVDPTDEAAPPDPPRGGSVPTDLRLAGLSGLAEEADESTAAHDGPRAGSVDGDDPTTCVSLPALAAALRAEAPPWS